MRGASKEIPSNYVLETVFTEDNKFYELWHDPKTTDITKAYIKKEVSK